MNNKYYYIKRKNRLLKNLKRFKKSGIKVLKKYYKEDEVEDIVKNIYVEYEKLIPQIPYIGGKENYLTVFLVNSIEALAVIIVLKNRGENREKIGEILFFIMYEYMNQLSPLKRYLWRRWHFSKGYMKKLKKSSKKSKEKRYPYDWVYDFEENKKDDSFDYKITYYECAIYKIYRDLGYEEYVPYLCLSDYANYKALNFRLERTKTIANGDNCCNFTYIKNGFPVEGWPPFNLKEFCNYKK